MFDTLKFARALRDGGQFTPEQAERLSDALSEAIAGEVAARSDLGAMEAGLGRRIDDGRAELKQEIADLRTELKQEITDLRTELVAVETRLDRKIEVLRAEMNSDIKGLEANFEAAKADTIKWVIGIISFQSVAIIGAAIVLARILAR